MLNMGKKQTRSHNYDGFALPTVLIASVVMLIVLLASVSVTVAVRTSLNDQYYNKLAKSAADAGLAYAKACIDDDGKPKWDQSKILKPNTGCDGAETEICPDSSPSQTCFVLSDNKIKSSFEVNYTGYDPLYKSISVTSVGKVKLLRSGNTVYRQYSSSKNLNRVVLTRKSNLVGATYTCAIGNNGRAYCWGKNANGQLGVGLDASDHLLPTRVVADSGGDLNSLYIKSLSVSDSGTGVGEYTCAIASNNGVYCWGRSNYGQAAGANNIEYIPVRLDTTGTAMEGKVINSISVGSAHACAADDSGDAYCWGNNMFGELGNGVVLDPLSGWADSSQYVNRKPVTVLKAGTALDGKYIKSISAGGSATCAIASSTSTSNDAWVYCWGYNWGGQLGNGLDGNGTNSSKAVKVVDSSENPQSALAPGSVISYVSSGADFACVLDSNGKAYCWGLTNHLGVTPTGNDFTPQPIAVEMPINADGSDKKFISIDSGAIFSCAIDSEYDGYCWGQNDFGQLGDQGGVTPGRLKKVNISGKKITSIGSGWTHACAADIENKVYCWGNNQNGRLGNGSKTNGHPETVLTPVESILPISSSFYF